MKSMKIYQDMNIMSSSAEKLCNSAIKNQKSNRKNSSTRSFFALNKISCNKNISPNLGDMYGPSCIYGPSKFLKDIIQSNNMLKWKEESSNL